MGHLAQRVSTGTGPVRRALSGWRLVPVALGTAAALAGCGAGGHSGPRVAMSPAPGSSALESSAHEHPATRQTARTSQTAATRRTASTASAAIAPGDSVSDAGAASGAGPGTHVTVRRSSAKRSGAHVRTATSRPGATIRVISGTRNVKIGTLTEPTSVFLVWTASAAPIQIFTSQGNLLLSSHARSGRIRLAPGQYPGLRVASPGAWTLRLHAAV
jgi:hypothetical protein